MPTRAQPNPSAGWSEGDVDLEPDLDQFPSPPAPPQSPYAPWHLRAAACLIDCGPLLVCGAVLASAYVLYLRAALRTPAAATNLSSTVLTLLVVAAVLTPAALAWTVANRWVRAGRTGRSQGRRLVGIALMGEGTLAPVGAANAIRRDLVHLVDILSLLGLLWPLWDSRHQTFADMLMRTVVLRTPTSSAEPDHPRARPT